MMNQETFSVEFYRNPRTCEQERAEREAIKAKFVPMTYDPPTVRAKIEELRRKRAENIRELREVR